MLAGGSENDDVAGPSGRIGRLIVLSGPSGSGKSSLVTRVLEQATLPLQLSISTTSRPPRSAERPGVHYHFTSREDFERQQSSGEFLEWAEVHGNLYGTPKTPVAEALAAGRWVVLEIDVHGARQVKSWAPYAFTFFLRAPSLENYAERLRVRGADSPESIDRRLADARLQLECAADYDFQIVNESLDQAARTFLCLLAGLATTGDRYRA